MLGACRTISWSKFSDIELSLGSPGDRRRQSFWTSLDDGEHARQGSAAYSVPRANDAHALYQHVELLRTAEGDSELDNNVRFTDRDRTPDN